MTSRRDQLVHSSGSNLKARILEPGCIITLSKHLLLDQLVLDSDISRNGEFSVG